MSNILLELQSPPKSLLLLSTAQTTGHQKPGLVYNPFHEQTRLSW